MGVARVIDGVHIVPMGMANAYLIEGDDGLTLIDAGFPNKEEAVFEAIRGLGRSPEQLRNLIFTHGHPDHIGSAAAIVRETGARTYMRSPATVVAFWRRLPDQRPLETRLRWRPDAQNLQLCQSLQTWRKP